MSKLYSLTALVLLLVGYQMFLPEARAATSCTSTMTNLAFGNVSPTGNTDVTATLTVTCITSGAGLLGGRTYVNMCFNIGAGAQGGTGILPRRMLNSFSDSLDFQMYKDAARTVVWGGTPYPATSGKASMDYPLGILGSGGSLTVNYGLYGRIQAQPTAAAGLHQNSFSGANTNFEYRYDEPNFLGGSSLPGSCLSGGDSGEINVHFPFIASATVPNHCDMSTASDLEFGNVSGFIAANIDQTSIVTLICTKRTSWNLGLNNGLNASGIIRRMRLGATGNYVTYELYRETGRTTRWGNNVNVDTVTGSSLGVSESRTVYGRVPAQAVATGAYSDIVTVTVYY